MKEHYTIRYHLYNTSKSNGIYVFMANANYREGDIWRKVNCSEPLIWVAYLHKLEEFKNLVGDRDIVCAYISEMIRKKNRDKVIELLEIHSPDEVKLMLQLLDRFIRITVIEDYVLLRM